MEHAIRGMIPHNKLGRAVYRKLKVYKGDEHPHARAAAANGGVGLTKYFHG